ncbi:TPA: hypothetical protein ACX6SN_003245 [Photobacterium damselae]
MSFGCQCWTGDNETVITTVQPMNYLGRWLVYLGQHTITIPGRLDGALVWSYAFGQYQGGTAGAVIQRVSVAGKRLTYQATELSRELNSVLQNPVIELYVRR